MCCIVRTACPPVPLALQQAILQNRTPAQLRALFISLTLNFGGTAEHLQTYLPFLVRDWDTEIDFLLSECEVPSVPDRVRRRFMVALDQAVRNAGRTLSDVGFRALAETLSLTALEVGRYVSELPRKIETVCSATSFVTVHRAQSITRPQCFKLNIW